MEEPMQLKTSDGRKIDPKDISYIQRGAERIGRFKVMGVEGISEWPGADGTLVALKNGEEVFLLHPENEVVEEMNKAKNG
jgi:hypothetical protein